MLLIFRFFLFVITGYFVPAAAAEPSIQEITAQAIKYSHLENEPLLSLNRRVRRAPWLPSIKTKFVGDVDYGESIRKNSRVAPTRMEKDFSGFGLEVEARWEFDRLVFNPEELAVVKESGRVFSQREHLIDSLIEAYFNRRLLQIELKKQSDPQQKEMDKLRIDELTAKLDGFTGGWFSLQMGAKP